MLFHLLVVFRGSGFSQEFSHDRKNEDNEGEAQQTIDNLTEEDATPEADPIIVAQPKVNRGKEGQTDEGVDELPEHEAIQPPSSVHANSPLDFSLLLVDLEMLSLLIHDPIDGQPLLYRAVQHKVGAPDQEQSQTEVKNLSKSSFNTI